jgi:cytochrome c oxidase subunit IV
MSSTDALTDEEYEALPTEPDQTGAHHPTELLYVKVAALLAAITLAEISTYWFDFGDFLLPALITMMVVKFALVIGYFMHLRFDNRIFTRVFLSGLFIAIVVYIVMLTTFHYWQNP